MTGNDEPGARPSNQRRVGYTGKGRRRAKQGRTWIEESLRATATMPPLEARVTQEIPITGMDPERADTLPMHVRQPDSWAPLPTIVADARERATQAFRGGDLERAVLEYQRASTLAPRDLGVSDSFAQVLATSGRRLEAGIELLRLAKLCADMGQRGEALRALNDAARLEPASLTRERLAPLVFRVGPRCRPACEQAIDEHLASGRMIEARDLLALLKEAQLDTIDMRYRLAEAEIALGRPKAGVQLMWQVLKHYRRNDHVAKWVPIAEEILRYGGPDIDLLWALSEVYLESDMPDRSLQKLQQLQRLVPNDLEVLERVAALQAYLDHVHGASTSLWRLVRAMRRAGSNDRQLGELLRRARAWNETRAYQEAIDALARRTLPVHEATRVTTPDWALAGNRAIR